MFPFGALFRRGALRTFLPMLPGLLWGGCADRTDPVASGRANVTGHEQAVSSPGDRALAGGLASDIPSLPVDGLDGGRREGSTREFRTGNAGPRFADVHEEAGLQFVFDNGSSRAKLMVESTSGGAGWLDYDRDGWWDLYLPQGGNPFADYQLPEAVIKLKQGFGRLIRTRRDTGTVVILDPRVLTRHYGRTFLESLPNCRQVRERVE